jgi:hypothetical protein
MIFIFHSVATDGDKNYIPRISYVATNVMGPSSNASTLGNHMFKKLSSIVIKFRQLNLIQEEKDNLTQFYPNLVNLVKLAKLAQLYNIIIQSSLIVTKTVNLAQILPKIVSFSEYNLNIFNITQI